ncbi:MAG: HTTM domain-containing protein, partial [Flavobacteriaceae bacterium]
HRLSWRMMLRSKSGTLTIRVEDKATGENKIYDYRSILSRKQQRSIKTKPDLMWQYAQRIKEDEKKNGKDVAVYFSSKVSINGGPYFQFTNPDVDIAAQKWKSYKHTDWLLTSPKGYHNK